MVHFVTCDQHAGEEADFYSRSFAPSIGIAEDPVTGTAHTALGAFYAHKKSGHGENEEIQLRGFQASERTGVVTCIAKGDRVRLLVFAVVRLTFNAGFSEGQSRLSLYGANQHPQLNALPFNCHCHAMSNY
jgi:predicted PhzF superfamily epimerase YddE/YHI9